MIYDGSTFLDSPPLTTQVCIVGTGQAGITLAWYLLQQGIDVTLLEGSRSRSRPNDPVPNAYMENENNLLYNGESVGLFEANEPQFLIRPTPQYFNNTMERERIYGGTSTHWGGQSRPLDPITFEKRPGFPGWPITREDLDPYYAEACNFLDLYGPYYGPAPDYIAGYNFTAEFWANELGQEVADIDGFDVDMYQFVPRQNLQFQARTVNGKTIGESDARVILNATLLNIAQQGGSVSELTIGVMAGDRKAPTKAGEFTIRADVYVLACGAVANAHQLLLSNIGNEYDLVGRYLMGHPIANKDGIDANAVSTDPSYLTSPEQQLLSYQNPNDVNPGKYPISSVAGLLTPNAEAVRANQTGHCWFGPSGTGNFYHELLPEYESRITLSDTTTDPVFGQPQSKAIWVLNENEQRNYEALTQLFETAVTAKGGGPVTINDWAIVRDKMVFNGHHLGTTRMSATEQDGVVDRNLRLHAVDNLYVAGSAVWAAAGISNPTFSIIAFSIRLADHLTRQLTGSAPARS